MAGNIRILSNDIKLVRVEIEDQWHEDGPLRTSAVILTNYALFILRISRKLLDRKAKTPIAGQSPFTSFEIVHLSNSLLM